MAADPYHGDTRAGVVAMLFAAQLFDAGLISEAEYAGRKKELLEKL